MPARRKLDEYQDEIVRLYQQGLDASQIATRIGCEAPAVRQRLKRAGVALRGCTTKGRPNGGRPPRQGFQSGDSRLPHLHLPRVQRDPCFMCGVRGDIPCRHRETFA